MQYIADSSYCQSEQEWILILFFVMRADGGFNCIAVFGRLPKAWSGEITRDTKKVKFPFGLAGP